VQASRTEALIKIIFDESESWDIRDDAARYLAGSDDPRAREVLIGLACDANGSDDLASSAGESLGEIAARTGPLPHDVLVRLRPDALSEYAAAFRHYSEDLSALPEIAAVLTAQSNSLNRALEQISSTHSGKPFGEVRGALTRALQREGYGPIVPYILDNLTRRIADDSYARYHGPDKAEKCPNRPWRRFLRRCT
jgi:hypothetical protein